MGGGGGGGRATPPAIIIFNSNGSKFDFFAGRLMALAPIQVEQKKKNLTVQGEHQMALAPIQDEQKKKNLTVQGETANKKTT